jgi:uncharacterized protein YqeY
MKETIQTDMVAAMKSGDKFKTNVLRQIKTAIQEFETSASYKGSTDNDDIIGIMKKMVKQRTEAYDIYQNNNKQSLALKEKQESDIIQEYLPAVMTTDELECAIKQIVIDNNLSEMRDMGKLLGKLSSTTSKDFNRGDVSKLFKSIIGK